MAMNDFVLVSPQVTNMKEWVRGRIIDIEDNPFRGTVITVQLENGDIYWDVADHFKTEA